MKLFIDYELNASGKSKFLQRLIPALEKIGVESSFKNKGCDVALGISKWRNKPDLPRVLRVDGIYLDGEDKRDRWINEEIAKSIKKSDAVIFQSRFAMKMVIKHLNPKIKKAYVIYNGANPQDYEVEKIDTGFEYNIIASAKWCNRHGLRKSKGLKETIRNMIESKMVYGENTGLFIAGDVPDKYHVDGIKFLGKLEEPELRRWLKTCDIMVYMATTDWCPNAVVEAIVAGCIIMHNPKCESVAELVSAGADALHIDNIARQYKDVFENTLTRG